jgi:hypothetical protein
MLQSIWHNFIYNNNKFSKRGMNFPNKFDNSKRTIKKFKMKILKRQFYWPDCWDCLFLKQVTRFFR